jgi:hypothetical protein
MALSQIPENRKVWARKPLIFPYMICGFCLEKTILRQSRSVSPDFLHRAIRRHSMHVQWRGLLLGMSLLSACTSVPTGPSVLALPAVGKPMDVFQAEDDGCRAYAQQQIATKPLQSQYDISYIQCMYSKGNAIPAVVAPGPRVPLPPPDAPPPSPAALPPPDTPRR